MSTVVTQIGIDLGKHSFHLHGQDAAGRMVFRKKCSRRQRFTLLGKPTLLAWPLSPFYAVTSWFCGAST